MGYVIQYNPENNKKFPVKALGKRRRKWLTALILTAIILGMMRTELGSWIKMWLLPGDAVQTEASLSAFVENIRAGEPLSDAVTTFCREIIDHAQIPS